MRQRMSAITVKRVDSIGRVAVRVVDELNVCVIVTYLVSY
jgi:hypothetical protein